MTVIGSTTGLTFRKLTRNKSEKISLIFASHSESWISQVFNRRKFNHFIGPSAVKMTKYHLFYKLLPSIISVIAFHANTISIRGIGNLEQLFKNNFTLHYLSSTKPNNLERRQLTFIADSSQPSFHNRRKLILDLPPKLLVDEALHFLGLPTPGADATLAERAQEVGQLDVLFKTALKVKASRLWGSYSDFLRTSCYLSWTSVLVLGASFCLINSE